MEIILYNSTAENIRVDKTNYITQILTLDGDLKEQTSIQNPSILIELPENSNALNVNYAYIPNFNRYYFIENISVFRNNLWRYDMSVDVLMSFKEHIYDLYVYVGRQEYEFNELLIDDLMPSENKIIIEREKINFGQMINPYIFPSQARPIVFTSVNNVAENYKYTPNMGYISSYLLNYYNLKDLNNFIMNGNFTTNIGLLFQNPSEGAISLMLFPFDLETITSQSNVICTRTVTNKIKIGSASCSLPDGHNCVNISKVEPITIDCGEINITAKYNNFLDYYPFTKIQIYLPFYGFTEIDTNMCMGKILKVSCYVDIISGKGIYDISVFKGYINDSRSFESIKNIPVTIGINIPLTSSNKSEIATNLALGAIKLIGSAATGLQLGSIGDVPKKTMYNGKPSKAYNKRIADYNDEVNSIKNNNKDFIINSISDTTVSFINNSQQSISFGNIGEGFENYNLPFYPIIIYSRPNPVYFNDNNPIEYMSKYRRLVGSPSSYNGLLGSLYGFTKVNGCHMEGLNSVSKPEIEEIENIIKSGIIMPDKPIE